MRRILGSVLKYKLKGMVKNSSKNINGYMEVNSICIVLKLRI